MSRQIDEIKWFNIEMFNKRTIILFLLNILLFKTKVINKLFNIGNISFIELNKFQLIAEHWSIRYWAKCINEINIWVNFIMLERYYIICIKLTH